VTTWLHEERLAAVEAVVLRETQAARVVDLGCGGGDLLVRLATRPGVRQLVGLDIRTEALERLRRRLGRIDIRAGKVELRAASMTDPAPDLAGVDCAVLLEVIEHLPPDHLSRLERALLHVMRPGRVVITTPNAEFNPLLGVPAHRFRHPDHRFEWGRAKFRHWAGRVAGRAGYAVEFRDIGGCHPELGGASQMALLSRTGAA